MTKNIRPELQDELNRLNAIKQDNILRAEKEFYSKAIAAFDGLKLSPDEAEQLKIYKLIYKKSDFLLISFPLCQKVVTDTPNHMKKS